MLIVTLTEPAGVVTPVNVTGVTLGSAGRGYPLDLLILTFADGHQEQVAAADYVRVDVRCAE